MPNDSGSWSRDLRDNATRALRDNATRDLRDNATRAPMRDNATRAPMRDDVVRAALDGLGAARKTLPPWLFYDQEGCRLFYEITRLPEYYLTRTEQAILTERAGEMVPDGLRDAALIEFGASSEDKAHHLLGLRDGEGRAVFRSYLPVDVALPELQGMQDRLRRSHPALQVQPVVADFMQPIALPAVDGTRFGFFPGSTIGNLDPDAAVGFLRRTHDLLGAGGWLLLGADLRKDPAVLLPAYNDAAGVTAAFNTNLLVRLSREAGADFDPAQFRHEAIWNDARNRIEMHLIAETDHTVQIAGRPIAFRRGETIHTENSYKHPPAAVTDFALTAGWQQARTWTDPAGWFGIFLFRRP